MDFRSLALSDVKDWQVRKNGRPAVWYSKEGSTFATAPSCDKVELVQSRMQWGHKKCTKYWGFSPASFIGGFNIRLLNEHKYTDERDRSKNGPVWSGYGMTDTGLIAWRTMNSFSSFSMVSLWPHLVINIQLFWWYLILDQLARVCNFPPAEGRGGEGREGLSGLSSLSFFLFTFMKLLKYAFWHTKKKKKRKIRDTGASKRQTEIFKSHVLGPLSCL